MKMLTTIPARKVQAATAGGALTTLIIYLVEMIWEIDLPTGVEGALSTLVVFAAGYFVPPASIDQIVAEDTNGERAE